MIPLADPLPLPAPVGLLWALLQVTFLLHLVAMNVVLGGSILALHWRFSRREEGALHRASLLAFFAKALPVAIAAAVTLGVAPLLFAQVLYGRLFFTSSILMAWLWLAIVPLVILAYYGAYLLAFRDDGPGGRARGVAALVALLFATAAFLQVSNATRALRPDTFVEAHRADRRGLLLNLGDPTFWPRYLHVLLGAVAVAALGAALYGVLRRAREPQLAAWAIRRGTTVFGVATAANVFVGMLFLLSQPKPTLIRLVGGDAWAMGLLALGIVLGVAAAGLALLALGAKDTVRVTWGQVGLLLATLVVMVLLRDQVRQLALRDAGFEHPAWVVAQWGPFAVFVVLLVAAVATIAWMARALARGRGSAALVLLAALGGPAVASPARAEEPAERRVESALAEARVAAKELSEAIRGLLMRELERGGLEGAVAVCSTTAQARTAEYRRTFGNDVRRVSLRRRNPANEPDAYERRVLESFDRLPAEARLAAEHWEVVREDGREALRYLKPVLASAMCLTCHGEKAKIPPAVQAVVAREYPDDRATGFSLGDVRGAVSVRIPLVSAR
ncbi:MAG TPA: DUF3365 domain-containing protein [Vicinamibacteria bacterium]|nr:DUF3365 domain-containing protein [Vicinamibacteria bacterium]